MNAVAHAQLTFKCQIYFKNIYTARASIQKQMSGPDNSNG